MTSNKVAGARRGPSGNRLDVMCPLSGDYKGHEEVVGFFKHTLALCGGIFAIEVHHVFAEDDVVAVLVVFMLLERKKIRVRFLRLVGHSQMVTTTLTVDEAGSRLSSFLLAQLAVNGGFAFVLGIGLSMIGFCRSDDRRSETGRSPGVARV
jgi:hypothetical protein